MRSALVTGACGLLGQHLVNRLKNSYNVTAVDIAPSVFDSHENITFIKRDLTEPGAVSELMADSSPDVVYNCAAFNDVDRCEGERDTASKLNVGVVADLISSGVERLVQFSSDYVFNGQNGPYAEDDDTDPLGHYGRTKLESEKMVLRNEEKHLIIRTNVLFGAGIDIRMNFVMWLIKNLDRGENIKVVTDQYNNPIHADNLAEAAIEAEEKDLAGILHIAGADYLSRYDLAVRTAEYFGYDRDLIHPVTTAELGQTALRPMRGGLKIDKAKKLLTCRLLKFGEGLELL